MKQHKKVEQKIIGGKLPAFRDGTFIKGLSEFNELYGREEEKEEETILKIQNQAAQEKTQESKNKEGSKIGITPIGPNEELVSFESSLDLTQKHDGIQKIKLQKNDKTLVDMDFDFSKCDIDLSKIKIKKQKQNKPGSIIINGIDSSCLQGTKTVFIDKVLSSNTICIHDAEIESIEEITSACNGENEIMISCDGEWHDDYRCTDLGGELKIEGLRHSGVKQYTGTLLTPEESEAFLKELANDTYNYLNAMEVGNGNGLPENYYDYPATGDYVSPEEAAFYMISHIGAYNMGFIGINTAKTRVEKTLDTLASLERTGTYYDILWSIGDNEAPPDYTAAAFDEFDSSAPFNSVFHVGTDPTSYFPKEFSWQSDDISIYFDLTAEQTNEDLYLILDTIYQDLIDVSVYVKSGALWTKIGTYDLIQDSETSILIPNGYLVTGENAFRLMYPLASWTIFDSVRLETGKINEGFFYRYYRAGSGVVDATEIPSIGNAMTVASLIVVKEWANEKGYPDIVDKAEDIYSTIDLRQFWNNANKMFKHHLTSTGHWDYYSDEGRLISFVANSLNQISDQEFTDNLNALARNGYYCDISTGNTVASSTAPEDILVEKTSWDGSMFTYFVPSLFIKEYLTNYQANTLNPAVQAQMTYASNQNYKINEDVVWGISDAYNVDNNYCWEYVGTPPTAGKYLSGNPYESCPGLLTPHASALALISDYSDDAIDNLYRLKQYSDLYDPDYGFKDSFNVNNGVVLDKVLTLDQEWIFLSLMDYFNGTVWDYFYKNPAIQQTHDLMYGSMPICTDNDNDRYEAEGGACGPIDCDDNNPDVYPYATEKCDGIDNDCDTEIDEGCESDFVTVEGSSFYLNGSPFYFSGANAYFLWYGNYNCNRTNPDPNGICVTEAFDAAQAMNFRVFRVWGIFRWLSILGLITAACRYISRS